MKKILIRIISFSIIASTLLGCLTLQNDALVVSGEEVQTANKLSLSASGETDILSFTGKYQQTSARKMIENINQFRTGDNAWAYKKDGEKVYYSNLSELTYDYELEKIAMQRAAELVVSYDHTRPDGTSCSTAYSDTFSNSKIGENIAIGRSSMDTDKTFDLWKEDDESYSGQGHRRNMLRNDFTAVGIAHFYYNGCHYWVQEFSSKTSDLSGTIVNDNNTDVSVKIAPEKITKKDLSLQYDSEIINTGKEYTLPDVKLEIRYDGMWSYSPSVEYIVTPVWSISTGNDIVEINNNKYIFSKPGDATLNALYEGQSINFSITAQCQHLYGEWTDTKNATCQEEGIQTRTCTICGDEETRTLSKTTHSYGNWTVTKQPTCVVSGEKQHKCSVCGKIETETIASTGSHNYSTEWTVDKQPTCTETGSKSNHCTTCDAKKDVTFIPAKEHNFVEISRVEATVNKEGQIKYICSDCGVIKTTYIPKSDETSTSKTDNISEVDNSSSNTDSSDKTNDSSFTEYPSSDTDNDLVTSVNPVSKKSKITSSTRILTKTYTGKQIKPAVKVTSGNKILKVNKDYTIKYGSNKIGKGTVTIIGKGNYTGKIVKTFQILPRATSIKAIAGKKKFTVRISKRTEATKYQLQYSTNNKFKGAKTINTKSLNKAVKAQSGKKYYVRVRVVNGSLAGKWSAVKIVKIK